MVPRQLVHQPPVVVEIPTPQGSQRTDRQDPAPAIPPHRCDLSPEGCSMTADVQDRPKATDTAGKRCVDYDQDCHERGHLHLRCWLTNPATGICPFLTGEVKA